MVHPRTLLVENHVFLQLHLVQVFVPVLEAGGLGFCYDSSYGRHVFHDDLTAPVFHGLAVGAEFRALGRFRLGGRGGLGTPAIVGSGSTAADVVGAEA